MTDAHDWFDRARGKSRECLIQELCEQGIDFDTLFSSDWETLKEPIRFLIRDLRKLANLACMIMPADKLIMLYIMFNMSQEASAISAQSVCGQGGDHGHSC